MDLGSAIKAHGEWKVKFRHAIAKKELVDAKSIAADHCCALGQWLHGEGKSRFGGLTSFTQCLAKHADFHREAGKVASAINAGRFQEAEAMLDSGTPYGAASNAIGAAVIALRKEASI